LCGTIGNTEPRRILAFNIEDVISLRNVVRMEDLMKKYKLFVAGAILAVLSVTAVDRIGAENIRIVVPYLGYIANTYESSDIPEDLTDSSLMKGLFFQWVNPQRYQWNTFIYQSSDINYSILWGGHLIFDLYFGVRERGKFVVGAGIEFIRLDMDAGDNISGLTDFELLNNIIVPYARFGRYFTFGGDRLNVSVLPWAGVQPEWVRGDISFTRLFPPPPSPFYEKTDDEELFGIAGLNTSFSILHFITIDAKYRASFNADEFFSSVDTMLNVFFTRHWGLSYRFKYNETSTGSTSYHIGGIAYVF
jgi:hypothetical protein